MARVAERAAVAPTRTSYRHALQFIRVFWLTAWTTSPGVLPRRLEALHDELALLILPDRRPSQRYPRAVKIKMRTTRANVRNVGGIALSDRIGARGRSRLARTCGPSMADDSSTVHRIAARRRRRDVPGGCVAIARAASWVRWAANGPPSETSRALRPRPCGSAGTAGPSCCPRRLRGTTVAPCSGGRD